MASIESERNEEVVVQLSSEQKARLDEVIKQAELSLKSEELFNQSLAVAAEKEYIDHKAAAAKLLGNYIVVAGGLWNYTNGGSLTTATDMQHQYAGSILKDWPNTLDYGNGSFSMGSNGSVEAAVVYYGKNNNRDKDCAWLIGFRVPQVYVVSGPMTDFNSLDWDEIKIKIERGGPSGSYYDKNTGTQIYASVASDPKSGTYYVSASFY